MHYARKGIITPEMEYIAIRENQRCDALSEMIRKQHPGMSFGARLHECLTAAEDLAAKGLSTTVADARFAKPLDTGLIERLAREHEVLITIEEGSIGGFASHVLQHLATAGLLDHGLKVRPMVLPDRFIDHASPTKQYADAGLDAAGIVKTALAALGQQAERARG